MTQTRTFGTGKRESHDASAFYGSKMMQGAARPGESGDVSPIGAWADRVYTASSENMADLPDRSVGLAFTSPPYNVGRTYDDDLSLDDYLGLISRVGAEVYRTLVPGGRYVINVANVGRKPYIPLSSLFWALHGALGFLPAGEVIWRKAKGAGGNCAWGSWRKASAPRLRDVHEYLLVMTKGNFSRPDKGVSTLGRDDFMASTLSVWEIAPASAKRIGHPAPFPVALAERVINLWSYQGDVILDPFVGSGTTCVAAKRLGRRWVGYDTNAEYTALAERRITAEPSGEVSPDTNGKV